MLVAAAALLVTGRAGALGRHPDSLSRTRVVVADGAVAVALTTQALTLLETLPGLDADGDGVLAREELAAGRAGLEAYVLGGLQVSVPPGGAALGGRLSGLRFATEADAFPDPYAWVELELELPLERPVREIVLENRLFLEQNPEHRDFTSVAWEGQAPVEVLFGSGWQRESFASADVRRPAVVATFLRLGVEHILAGYDHLAFLLALIVAAPRARSLVGVVTAFTVAHSLTLAAAALGWLELPGRLVELAIALSIAYVGCENLLQREPRTPWLEAFGFGLLHGLGFAGFLAGALAGEPLVTSALLGFNLGVELGQLAVVVPLVALLALASRGRRGTPSVGIVPRRAAVGVSAVVAAFGFLWFFQRTGWFA